MTQEEKQLLLKDICARLPYGVIIHRNDYFDPKYPRPNETLTIGNLAQYTEDIERWGVKPYLHPMSSMTKEEREEIVKLHIDDRITSNIEICDANCVDFYNSHHLDYRGLIPMGLALEAPEGMYKTE